MLQHLNNDDLTELSLHSDEQALKELRAAMTAQHQQSTERDEEFWERQRKAVWKRIASREQVRAPRRLPALAWSVALIALAATLLWMRHTPVAGTQSARMPIQKQVQTQMQDQDSALLAQVEDELDSDGPASLQPAEVLTEAMSQTSSPEVKQVQKENKRQ